MSQQKITLEEKYILEKGKIHLSGIQALVRIPLDQKRIDKKNSLNTAGYVSGYRGSPLGGLDSAFWKAKSHLTSNNIFFKPSINEDIAATACWGTQQVGLTTENIYDGVFSIWYGKGPGVDRSGDPLKHANLAGTSKYGGVLALAGDDHLAKSSTSAHQSEQSFISAMIPIFNPSNVQELIDYGLFGIAMSRFAGVWVGLKCVTEIVESTSTILIEDDKKIIIPEKFYFPEGGVNIRWPDDFLEQERRMLDFKLEATKYFVKVNKLNYVTHKSDKKELGIISAGKAWSDICAAFSELEINQEKLEKMGVSVFKVSMPWPLEIESVLNWARGFKKILILEEKRNIIEDQVARALYFLKDYERPNLFGKTSQNKNVFVPSYGDLNTRIIKDIFYKVFTTNQKKYIKNKLNISNDPNNIIDKNQNEKFDRTPWFCAGCPHNSSTKVPKRSKAFSGIGCHFMVNSMNRDTATFTHMGGEGASWIGIAPFVKEKHIFQNIGDGTYFHSGILSIRAAVASGINITFKILFNNAVALTGGQSIDGNFTPVNLSWQLNSEGVNDIGLITNNVNKYKSKISLPKNVKLFHRNELEKVQLDFREKQGVTAIIFDQECAAELRRKRKKNILPKPKSRVYINSDVCEGCGDCNISSNCVAIQPLETEFGRKRIIDQDMCNIDLSCLNGFCPSFITVEGDLHKNDYKLEEVKSQIKKFKKKSNKILYDNDSYNILLAGIGGSGIVTVGAIISMAAHIDGNFSSVLDQTGLSQKNGSVFGHIKISKTQSNISNYKIDEDSLDLLLGFDSAVAASKNSLSLINKEKTVVFLEEKHTPLPILAEEPDLKNSSNTYLLNIKKALENNNIIYVNAYMNSKELFNDSIFFNIYFLGFVYQSGLIPINLSSLEEAIKLNNVSVEENLTAFYMGMLEFERKNHAHSIVQKNILESNNSYEDSIEKRRKELTVFQNLKYADKYVGIIEQAKNLDANFPERKYELTETISINLFKLMIFKDEFYVSHLLTKKAFFEKIKIDYYKINKIYFHLSPPLLSFLFKKYKKRKIKLGYWLFWFLVILSKFKFLRNTYFDPFMFTQEKKDQKVLLNNYLKFLYTLERKIDKTNYSLAVEIASLPNMIRGYGYVRRKSIEKTNILRDNLMEEFVKEK